MTSLAEIGMNKKNVVAQRKSTTNSPKNCLKQPKMETEKHIEDQKGALGPLRVQGGVGRLSFWPKRTPCLEAFGGPGTLKNINILLVKRTLAKKEGAKEPIQKRHRF